MSHGIEVENGDVVVLGSGKPAWHNIGTVFAGLLSPLRAHAEGVGAANIEEVPLLVEGMRLTDWKGLVAVGQDGKRRVLTAVKKSYGVLQDSSFFEILEKVYDGRAVVETAGTLRGGKRIWCLVKRDTWEVNKGDGVETYDLWVNRHDGSGCFELHTTMVRVVCQNTWSMAVGDGRNRVFGVKHTTGVLKAAEEAAELLKSQREEEKAYRAKVQLLAKARMSQDRAHDFFCSLLRIDQDKPMTSRTEEKLTQLQALFKKGIGNEGRTAWDAFNAVTEWVDHTKELRIRRGRDLGEARFEDALLGGGDDLKARALEDLLTVK